MFFKNRDTTCLKCPLIRNLMKERAHDLSPGSGLTSWEEAIKEEVVAETPYEGDILVITLNSKYYSFTGNNSKHGGEWKKIFYIYCSYIVFRVLMSPRKVYISRSIGYKKASWHDLEIEVRKWWVVMKKSSKVHLQMKVKYTCWCWKLQCWYYTFVHYWYCAQSKSKFPAQSFLM